MKVVQLPSTFGSGVPLQYLTTYLVNDTVAIDAGSVGFYRETQDQARVRHVFLTHGHLDHIASLAVFLENVFQMSAPDCVTVHATAETIDTLRRDLFNNRVWPDFVALSDLYNPGFLKLSELKPNQPCEVEGLRLTPVPIHHVVPTVGYLIQSPGASIAVVTDTGPTEAIWELARATPDLKAVLLEATFPDALASLAKVSGHYHTQTFLQELGKLPEVPVFAIHLKARYAKQVADEIHAARHPRVQIMVPGHEYQF
jgi:cAMP phosphodiesterase